MRVATAETCGGGSSSSGRSIATLSTTRFSRLRTSWATMPRKSSRCETSLSERTRSVSRYSSVAALSCTSKASRASARLLRSLRSASSALARSPRTARSALDLWPTTAPFFAGRGGRRASLSVFLRSAFTAASARALALSITLSASRSEESRSPLIASSVFARSSRRLLSVFVRSGERRSRRFLAIACLDTEGWRARRDSNPLPPGSKPGALIRVSYGRVGDDSVDRWLPRASAA